MRSIRKAGERGHKPGEWFKSRHGTGVYLCCPECGQSYLLDHVIAEDGNVTPSVECPTFNCTFHEYIKLGDWLTESTQ